MCSNSTDCASAVWNFRETNSDSDTNNEYLGSEDIQNSEFGHFYDTYNWIECESKSYPGKIYYFNLRTSCSTWTRPISRNVQLQRFQRKSRVFHNNFTSDLDDPPMIILSESEDHEYTDSNDTKRKHDGRKYKKSTTLAHLYRGVSTRKFSDNNDCDSSDESVCSLSEDTYDLENCFAFSDSSFFELGKHFLTKTVPNKIQTFEEDVYENIKSPVVTADFLEIEVCTSENIRQTEQPLSEDDVSSIAEVPIVYSTSSSDENEVESKYSFVPRLPKIKTKYLLKDIPLNNRKRRNFKRRVPPKRTNLKPTKIVCEMYGTKTINYDNVPIEPKPAELQLPPGVKQSNLSDSSVTSTLWQAENSKSVQSDFEFPNINLHLNLSSESSFSSCSDCSCSPSSDTEKTNSN